MKPTGILWSVTGPMLPSEAKKLDCPCWESGPSPAGIITCNEPEFVVCVPTGARLNSLNWPLVLCAIHARAWVTGGIATSLLIRADQILPLDMSDEEFLVWGATQS